MWGDFISLILKFLGISKEQAPYIVILGILVFIGVRILKNLFDRFEDSLYDQIERLAADNRMYRDVYLARLGLSPEERERLSAATLEPSHGKRRTKGKRRRK
ncbi:MAG: hypothetical protein FVQ80_15445 [Planctomycetes bacterium]|nr:hypothetical protein [Planctomycetota bacterium]